MARVTLYTKSGCPHCDRWRESLLQSGDSVHEVNLTQEPQATNELLKLTGGRAVVPVIVRGATIEVAPDGGSEL